MTGAPRRTAGMRRKKGREVKMISCPKCRKPGAVVTFLENGQLTVWCNICDTESHVPVHAAHEFGIMVCGRWEKSNVLGEDFKCSVCGGSCWYYDYKGTVKKSRFCPNCGSLMTNYRDEKEA